MLLSADIEGNKQIRHGQVKVVERKSATGVHSFMNFTFILIEILTHIRSDILGRTFWTSNYMELELILYAMEIRESYMEEYVINSVKDSES